MQLRWHLSGLVLGLLIPLLLLLAGIVVFLVERERGAVERGMDRTVRALATAFDAVALDTIGTLRALAASNDLRPDSLQEFLADVRDAPAIADGEWAILTLVDARGEERLRIDGPDGGGAALPPAAESEPFAAVMTTGQPALSTLATTRTASGDLLLPIAVPVLRAGSVQFVLIAFYKASVLDRILAEQRLDPGWVVAVVDRANRIIARSHDGKGIIGQQASPQFAAALIRAEAGGFASVRRDGIASINRFVRSARTGWTTVLSAPEEALLAPGRRLAWTIGIASVLFLAAGLAVTALLGRRIARPIISLGAPARALGRGEPLPPLPRTSIAEVGVLARDMANAAALLEQRQRESRDAESRQAVHTRRQAEVAALGIEALQQTNLDAFLDAAARRAAAALDVDIGSVFEVLADGEALRLRAGSGWGADAVGRLTVPTGPRSHAGFTLSVGEPVVVDDYATETRFEVPAFVRGFGVVSGLAAVLHGPAAPFGVLAVGSRKHRLFTPDDVSFLQAAANVLSTAIARQAADQALQRSEERHRRVVELAQEIIWVHVDGRIVFANPRAALATGFAGPDELIGRDVFSLFHPADRQQAVDRTLAMLSGAKQPVGTLRLLRPDGSVVVAEFRSIRLPQYGASAVLALGHEVTERLEAENALRRSERRFREFAEAASDYLWEMDAELRFTFISRDIAGMKPLLGVAADEFPRLATDPEALRAHVAEMRAHRPFRDFVYSWNGEDQRTRHMRVSGRPIFDERGVFQGYRGIGTDITEEMESAERLRQAQKMEAVGQLTGGIAHDFNNLLSVVIGNAEMLLERIDPQDKLGTALVSQLSQAGARGADLTGRLLAFSRRQPLKPRLVQLNELVRSVEPLLRRTLGENVEIRTGLAPDLGTTVADAGQIENALLNLAVNARDAMPDGGQLLIETKNVELDDSYAASVGDLQPGPYVMLAVSDTGCGMTPEVRQRAFEPFFTTKEKGKGTGLGLAMIYGFVRQSGGHASIYSEVDVGTTVRLYLPRSDAGAEAAAEPAEAGAMLGRGETVLLVEDDRDVRDMLALRLADLGYDVVEAQHGRAAIDMIRQDVAVDIVLTDVVMPGGIDGWDLAQLVWKERPGLPVIFMTGYTDNVILRRAGEDQTIKLLSKPFRQRDLAEALREALDGRRR